MLLLILVPHFVVVVSSQIGWKLLKFTHTVRISYILHVHCKRQDKNANRIDLNWFKLSFHQIAKLTSIAMLLKKEISQADRLYSVYFATHLWNLKSKKQSSWKYQSVNRPVIILILISKGLKPLFLLLLLIHKLDESYYLKLHKLLFTSRLTKQEWHHNESYFRSLDGIHQIAKLTNYAAEVLIKNFLKQT